MSFLCWPIDIEPRPCFPLYHFSMSVSIFQQDSHYMVIRPSYLYNGNTYTWKDSNYIETRPCFPCAISPCQSPYFSGMLAAPRAECMAPLTCHNLPINYTCEGFIGLDFICCCEGWVATGWFIVPRHAAACWYNLECAQTWGITTANIYLGYWELHDIHTVWNMFMPGA